MPKTATRSSQRWLVPLVVFFSFFLPLLFLILGMVIFKASNKFTQTITEEGKTKTEERLSPSQVLKNKTKYHDEKIWLRGRVSLTPVVCEKKDCSQDICCGCPQARDIIISDAGSILKSSGEEKLNLKDIFTGESLCQRKQGSCDYDCGDWIKGGIYDIYGKLFADTPPPGWQKSLNFYFEVEGKNLVKTVNFSESFGNFINDIKDKFNSLKTSGQYVLP